MTYVDMDIAKRCKKCQKEVVYGTQCELCDEFYCEVCASRTDFCDECAEDLGEMI